MPDPTPDALPERTPTLQRVWRDARGVASFNRLPAADLYEIEIPSPWRLVCDPAVGAAYLPPVAGEAPHSAAAVFDAAAEKRGGFRIVGLSCAPGTFPGDEDDFEPDDEPEYDDA
jgi:hypothetical protein